ncbi:MAG: FHA domain-containing protein, partial [Acidobacteriia bacterium]|nr:FHA domain-containing protein [Terriglobia bacterium]
MARFLIAGPSGETQIFEISSPTVNIGRVEANDLVLDHPSVSRHHARLTVLPGDTTLLNDLGSLNGTFVNGQQIHEHRLADQDRVNVGMYELRFELARTEP